MLRDGLRFGLQFFNGELGAGPEVLSPGTSSMSRELECGQLRNPECS